MWTKSHAVSQKKGYWIKHKNYRTKIGEIDLIATAKDLIVFVEVKALVYSEHFTAQDHFDWKKQRKRHNLGKQYTAHLSDEFYARFDLITVTKKDGDYFIEHFENVIDDSLYERS